jgi:hypothetical protein
LIYWIWIEFHDARYLKSRFIHQITYRVCSVHQLNIFANNFPTPDPKIVNFCVQSYQRTAFQFDFLNFLYFLNTKVDNFWVWSRKVICKDVYVFSSIDSVSLASYISINCNRWRSIDLFRIVFEKFRKRSNHVVVSASTWPYLTKKGMVCQF